MQDRYLREGVDFWSKKTAEEAGELVSILMKTLNYGWDSSNPELPPEERILNRHLVEKEMDDVIRCILKLRQALMIDHVEKSVKEATKYNLFTPNNELPAEDYAVPDGGRAVDLPAKVSYKFDMSK